MRGISPRRWSCCSIKLMVFLTGYVWYLHRWYSVDVARRQNGRASSGGSLGRALYAGHCDRVTLVRFTVSETLREWITGNLQLCYTMILISGYRGESRLLKRERFEILCAGIRAGTRWRWCHYNVTSRLVPMHRVEDYLER